MNIVEEYCKKVADSFKAMESREGVLHHISRDYSLVAFVLRSLANAKNRNAGRVLKSIRQERIGGGLPKEISKDDLVNGYKGYLTVGDLKDFLNNNNHLSDDAKVLVQRVEDLYYEENSWGVHYKKGNNAYKDENGELVKESLEQYHPAWCCVKYADEDDILFIDLHY